MKNCISIIIFILFVKCTFAQAVSKSLFLVVDRKSDTFFLKGKTRKNFRYNYSNEKRNWNLSLYHNHISNSVYNNYKYSLPKEMITELKRKGNLEDIQLFMAKLNDFNIKELGQFFSKHYSYYYEYLEKNRKKTFKRYNIFIVFKADLDKTFVPCYEVALLKSRIEVQ